MNAENWIVAYGDLGNGFTFVGPFPSLGEAEVYVQGEPSADKIQVEYILLQTPAAD